MTSLSKLKKLRELYLNSTDVSDISPLKRLKNLKKLRLDSTKVSKKDILALKKALPDCKISSDFD
ncbi:MAG TPA: hypothetical protein ENI73_06260 [Spirochaetes bacterium]|nr:hypothetical protein [Spirochaetota bacterium]